VVALGFGELAPDVGEAADGGNLKILVAVTESLVSSQAVALKVAVK
jgi:hypothetical protein